MKKERKKNEPYAPSSNVDVENTRGADDVACGSGELERIRGDFEMHCG